ncbi:MAG TPA: alanyl-tRNA editing protein [Anaerolineae bacterium]|nr:alanyl-tRNA editing protein [Anaerolineae bacterium]
MTEALYQTDSYIREFEAVVTAIDGQAVTLHQTAFYPGGGGQPNDVGALNWDGGSAPVVKVRKQGAAIWHTLEGTVPPIETKVHGTLDWEHRYRLMRTHTALHVLCGVVWRDYGASVTGGNMEPLKGRMDFEFETMRKELVAEIEANVNAEIEKGHAVCTAILPRQEAFQIPDLIRTKINLLPPQIQEVRTVEIVDLDLQADGGTHVANTREVGRVRVADYKSKGAINKRIYLELEAEL